MKPNFFIVDGDSINLRRIQYGKDGCCSDCHVATIIEIRDKSTLKVLINFLRGSGITDDEAGISERFEQ